MKLFKHAIVLAMLILLFACTFRRHGWEYVSYYQEEVYPQMVIVEGDTLGSDTVRAFCMSKYEETNFQYRCYLQFLLKYKQRNQLLKALPDTTVWMKTGLSADEKAYYIKNYFRDKKFDNYPVVGLNKEQIKKYCYWKTDRANEMILIREGILLQDTSGDPTQIFHTDTFLMARFDYLVRRDPWRKGKMLIPNLDAYSPERSIRMEDGILFPRLRLPIALELKVASLSSKKQSIPLTPNRYGFPKRMRSSFPYFSDIKKEKKNRANVPGIVPVNSGTPDYYGIYHINSNVSEAIMDAVDSGALKTSELTGFRLCSDLIYDTKVKFPYIRKKVK